MKPVKDIDVTARVFEISKLRNLSHLGSNLTAVGIIDEIYWKKADSDIFILSCGHAGLALYCVLEKYYGYDALALYDKHGTHPNHDPQHNIYCSTGSLGMGIGIALGYAMAGKKTYCLISDGEMFEGAIWEASNVRGFAGNNLVLYLNYNGYSALSEVTEQQVIRLQKIWPEAIVRHTNVKDYGFKGLEAHYVKL